MKTIEELTISMSQTIEKMTQREKFNLLSEAKIIDKKGYYSSQFFSASTVKVDKMAKTAFLGLGVMGYPMAGHLARTGHDVTVYNRTVSKAEQWLDEYSEDSSGELLLAPSAAGAAADADFVFACVGADKDITICPDYLNFFCFHAGWK